MDPTARRRRDGDRLSADDLERLDSDLRRARRPALLTVPDQLRRGRFAVSSTAVVAVLALALALGCVFVVRVVWAERSMGAAVPATVESGPENAAAPVVVAATSRLSTAASPPITSDGNQAGAVGGPSASLPAASVLVVHVVGQVSKPGLVRLRVGARVADALAAAGGARGGADLTALNLARPVVDGEQVHVPRPGEVVTTPPLPVPPGGGSSAVASLAPVIAPVLDLNAADLAALDTLPGVGPVLAQRILDWRTEHGRFSTVDELGEVSGIGDKLLANVRARVRV